MDGKMIKSTEEIKKGNDRKDKRWIEFIEYSKMVSELGDEKRKEQERILKIIDELNGNWGYNDDGTPDEDVVSIEELKSRIKKPKE